MSETHQAEKNFWIRYEVIYYGLWTESMRDRHCSSLAATGKEAQTGYWSSTCHNVTIPPYCIKSIYLFRFGGRYLYKCRSSAIWIILLRAGFSFSIKFAGSSRYLIIASATWGSIVADIWTFTVSLCVGILQYQCNRDKNVTELQVHYSRNDLLALFRHCKVRHRDPHFLHRAVSQDFRDRHRKILPLPDNHKGIHIRHGA